MNLLDSIVIQLHQQGAISFADFMQKALYTPNLGYYTSATQKLGAGGDFITAPELTPLFGQTLAHQCLQVLQMIERPILFEFGAGSGQLCVDILTHLERINGLPDEYHILEVSGHLQSRQQALIQEKIPHLAHQVRWLSQWPTQPFNGVVIANEVLDAMPVHRFLQLKDRLLESYIVLDGQGNLSEQFKDCVTQPLIDHVRSVLPRDRYPYQSEANLFIDDWLRQCHSMLEQGALFIMDYGFPRHEYYHPDRHRGTLMCHYRHRVHTDPLIHLGEQDITAHVDFTHLADAGSLAGFHVAGYTNQASFLLANGLLSLLSEIDNEHERIYSQQAVKQLLQPNEMGELFKVMALTKNMALSLSGFQLQDKRASL
jgi:SAM-dependent MidA family methyltransferase